MSRIIGVMPIDLNSPLVFYRRTPKGFVVADEFDLKNASELLVLVPSTEVGIFLVDLPVRSEAEARRAAVFAIEDELAVAPDEVHLVLGNRSTTEKTRYIFACSEEILSRWIARLKTDSALRNAQLIPDAWIVPPGKYLLELPDRVVARTDDRMYAIDTDLTDDILKAIVPSDPHPSVIGGALASRLGFPEIEQGDALQTLWGWAHESETPMDLRQGKFARKRNSKFELAKWKVPASLAAAASLTWVSAMALENRAIDQLTAEINEQSNSIYSTLNPGQPVPRNLVQSVRTNSNSRSTLDFRTASSLLYSSINLIEGAGIQSLRFEESSQIMRARITYGKFGDELRLQEHLEKTGIAVRIGETRQQNGSVSGDITMELSR